MVGYLGSLLQEILHNACEGSLRHPIVSMQNAVVLNAIRPQDGAATGEYGDMLKMGILDLTKVTRTALQNAASVAGLMITTEAMSPNCRRTKHRPAAVAWAEWVAWTG